MHPRGGPMRTTTTLFAMLALLAGCGAKIRMPEDAEGSGDTPNGPPLAGAGPGAVAPEPPVGATGDAPATGDRSRPEPSAPTAGTLPAGDPATPPIDDEPTTPPAIGNPPLKPSDDPNAGPSLWVGYVENHTFTSGS